MPLCGFSSAVQVWLDHLRFMLIQGCKVFGVWKVCETWHLKTLSPRWTDKFEKSVADLFTVVERQKSVGRLYLLLVLKMKLYKIKEIMLTAVIVMCMYHLKTLNKSCLSRLAKQQRNSGIMMNVIKTSWRKNNSFHVKAAWRHLCRTRLFRERRASCCGRYTCYSVCD